MSIADNIRRAAELLNRITPPLPDDGKCDCEYCNLLRANPDRDLPARLLAAIPAIEALEARDKALMTKHGAFKGTGNVELDACLQAPDPAFTAFVESLPPTYWARYDLSAVRLGWHHGREATLAQTEPKP